jgi:tRNA (guanine-N7-)-methyltransferase
VAFLRTKIEFITSYFDASEVEEIWLTFSDPQPKDKKGTKRLTGKAFLERYRQFLKPEGIIHVKTDSPVLYEKTHETIKAEGCPILADTSDLYGAGMEHFTPEEQEILNVRTFYEKMWLEMGKHIHYIRFQLNGKTD